MDSHYTEVYSWGSSWQQVTDDLGNCLVYFTDAYSRHQAEWLK